MNKGSNIGGIAAMLKSQASVQHGRTFLLIFYIFNKMRILFQANFCRRLKGYSVQI